MGAQSFVFFLQRRISNEPSTSIISSDSKWNSWNSNFCENVRVFQSQWGIFALHWTFAVFQLTQKATSLESVWNLLHYMASVGCFDPHDISPIFFAPSFCYFEIFHIYSSSFRGFYKSKRPSLV